MRRPLALSLALCIAAVLCVAASCQTQERTLSPAASTAFTQTRIIRALDLVRDAAIAANEQPVAGCIPSEAVECPPLLSTETTRAIVEYHRSAIILVHDAPSDWRTQVMVGFDQVLENLPERERQILGPYAALIRSLTAEAIR